MGIKGMSGYQVGALTTQSGGVYRDQSSFWLAPFESVEFKYTLSEGQSMVFDWRAKSIATADVIYEMHSEVDADPEQSVTFAARVVERASAVRLLPPFDGVHGWYWENRGTEEVEVVLEATGFLYPWYHLRPQRRLHEGDCRRRRLDSRASRILGDAFDQCAGT